MESLLFSDFQAKDTNNLYQPGSNSHSAHEVTIQPWFHNNKITNKTLPIKKQESLKQSEKAGNRLRKKSIDERIQQMYRKYSKDTITNCQTTANSREDYRRMLQEFEKAQQFKQLGLKRQKRQTQQEIEPFQLEIINQKINNNVCSYDCHETEVCPAIQKNKNDDKCVNRFQRMLKIRDKVRKKNSVAVTKLKEKYLSQYNPSWPCSQRQQQIEGFKLADREKAKMKIRIRNQSKSKYTLEGSNQKEDIKIVGVYSNALAYVIQRGNRSGNAIRQSKLNTIELNRTFHGFRN